MIGLLAWATIDFHLMLWLGLTQIQNELLSWCNIFAGRGVEEGEESL